MKTLRVGGHAYFAPVSEANPFRRHLLNGDVICRVEGLFFLQRHDDPQNPTRLVNRTARRAAAVQARRSVPWVRRQVH